MKLDLWKTLSCPRCGKSLLVAAEEKATPDKHCTCPGGPVWQRIAKMEKGNWHDAYRRWESLPEDERKNHVVFPFDGHLYMVAREKWDEFLEQYFVTE